MEKKFAFLVHPRANVAEDMGRVWGPLGLVPDPAYDWALRRLPIPPVPFGTVRRSDRPDDVAGWIVLVPVGARQMLTSRRTWAIDKVEQAVDKAVALGVEVVGLGALTASVTAGGRRLRHRPGITITNGNAFTAHLTAEAITRLAPLAGRRHPHIAFVGATGSVGHCVVELVAGQGTTDRVTIVARNRGRLESLADRVTTVAPGTAVDVATDMHAIATADLVVMLTSSADALIRSEHLKLGAVVLDDTQPRNTDPALVHRRPDVVMIDGGMAEIPGVDIRADIGLRRGYAYACLCETMLLAFDGHDGDFCIGNATVDQARHMAALADRHRHLGFELGDFLSFGRPIDPQPLVDHAEAV